MYTSLMDFSEILKPGLKAEKTEMVTEKNTAFAIGSGGLAVFSTPSLITLLEVTSRSIVDPLLPPGWSSVGTELNVKHISATPLGMKITAKSELVKIDGRALLFKVEAFDEAGKISEGTHSRFIIDNEKFLAKTAAKKA